MEDPQKTGCDVDDILCQLRVLASLKTLQDNMGKESFAVEFPELQGMDTKIKEKIATQKVKLSDAIRSCGDAVDPDEIPAELLHDLEEDEEE